MATCWRKTLQKGGTESSYAWKWWQNTFYRKFQGEGGDLILIHMIPNKPETKDNLQFANLKSLQKLGQIGPNWQWGYNYVGVALTFFGFSAFALEKPLHKAVHRILESQRLRLICPLTVVS